MTAFTFTPTDRAAILALTTRHEMDFFAMTSGQDAPESAIFTTDEGTELASLSHTALPLGVGSVGAVATIVAAEGAVVLEATNGQECKRFGDVKETLAALRQAQLRYGEVAWDRLPG